jgi:energy-converting hydrogenase Eha subunit C
LLRRLRFTSPEIAQTLGMPLSTVGAVLSRNRLGKLPRLGPQLLGAIIVIGAAGGLLVAVAPASIERVTRWLSR